MRIGINLLGWVPGRRGGAETYSRNLLAALLELNTSDTFVVFLGQEGADALELDSPYLEESVCPVASRWRPLRAAWEQFFFGRWVARTGVEVLYCPHSLLPTRSLVPAVQLVLDLQVFDLPEHFGGVKRKYLYRRLPASAYCAEQIISISQFTKQKVVEHLCQPAEKITTIWLAAGREYHPRAEEEVAGVRQNYGLERPYLLTLATSHKHKLLDRLVRVFDRLKGERGWEDRLILGGLPGSGHHELMTALSQCRHKEDIRHLGRVASGDLPARYTGARAFIFPSSYEGFGLPVVEAMACGTPVVSSNRGSLPEVADGAALLFDPLVEQEMATSLQRVVEEPGLRAHLREQGLRRVQPLSWEKTARETLQVLREVGERGKR